MEVPSPFERRLAGAIVKSVFLRDRRGGPWQPPAELPATPLTFEGNTGASLAGLWFAAERPRGAVVLAHPDRRYAKHWFVKEGWVAFLLENGYDVLTFDLTGYGESRGPATYFHEDIVAAARVAQRWSGGFPVHVIGVSMGAFAACNASPRLDFVRSLVLESPYPSFNAWYAKGPGLAAMRAFDAIFPRTSAAIQADRNVAAAQPKRVLVAWSDADEVTRPALSEAIARAAPAERTETFRHASAPHLKLFEDPEYRRAILRTLAG